MPELALLDEFLAAGATDGVAAGSAATEGTAGAVATTGDNVQVDVPQGTKNAPGRKKPSLKQIVGAADKGQKAFSDIIPSKDDIPVPTGGVALLILIAIVIVFAIIPAPGQDMTRLQLIWQAILGNATLGDDSGPVNNGVSVVGNVPIVGGQTYLASNGVPISPGAAYHIRYGK